MINVHSAYYHTIRDTVRFYFEKILNMPVEVELADKGVILNFKMIGGFNDDWEICAALILFYLWKMKEYNIQLTYNLKNNPPLISDFINKYLTAGDGLPNMVSWIKENSAHAEEIFLLWNQKQIIQIALEFYAGEKYCSDFYYLAPQYVKLVNGNIDQESILLDPKLVKIIRKYWVGIFTGRGRAETNYILQKLDWLKWIPPEAVITLDSGIKKPSALGLNILRSRFQSKIGLYMGDTMDDFLTVENLNQEHKETKFLSAIVVGNDLFEKKEKGRIFLPRGLDLLSEDVNQLLLLLDNIRSGCAP